MHLSTIVSSFVLAAVVAASPTPMPSEQSAGDHKITTRCFSGCPVGVPAFNGGGGFVQGPVVFSQQGSFSSFSSFTSSMNVFSTACTSTVSAWQGISSIQIIHQQFQYMIVSMSTLFASFQTGCNICNPGQSIAFTQTVTQVIVQVQSMVSFIYTQFGGQIVVFQQEFSVLSLLFQTIIGIGATLNVNMQQLFITNQFNFQLFNSCGIQTNAWFQTGGVIFPPQHVALLAQLLSPVLLAIRPVLNGVGDLLTGLGVGVSNLLGNLL